MKARVADQHFVADDLQFMIQERDVGNLAKGLPVQRYRDQLAAHLEVDGYAGVAKDDSPVVSKDLS